MKNKISKLTLIACAFGLSTQLSAQKSEIKHFTVGIGAAFEADGEGIAQNTKFDFNITPKFSIGVKNNLVLWDKKTTQVNPPDDNGVESTISWRSPIYNNASLVGSYSIIGTNQNDKKFNLNVFAGLGLRYYVFKMDFTHSNIPPNTAYTDRSIDKYSTYLISTGLSCSYKLGPGKIYAEIPVFIDMYKKQTYITEYDNNPIFNSESTITFKLKDEGPYNFLATVIGFNLGYQINF
jgi:hypothetical protein